MKQHAQKFPACNLNGARAFYMKKPFWRLWKTGQCQRLHERKRTEGFLRENLSRKHRIE